MPKTLNPCGAYNIIWSHYVWLLCISSQPSLIVLESYRIKICIFVWIFHLTFDLEPYNNMTCSPGVHNPKPKPRLSFGFSDRMFSGGGDLVTFTEEILNGKLHFLWSLIQSHHYVKFDTFDTFEVLWKWRNNVFILPRDLTLKHDQRKMLLGNWEPLNLSHHLAKFDGYRSCGNGGITFWFCHSTLYDQMIKVAYHLVSGNLST